MHITLTSRGATLEWSNARGASGSGSSVGVGGGLMFKQKSGWSVVSRRSLPRWGRWTGYAAEGDTTRPTLTGSITVGVVTTSSIAITWPAGSDNVAVTSYEVSSNGGGSWAASNGATSTTAAHVFSGLTPDTSYAIQVRAKDAAGNVSTPALAVTQFTQAPETPTVDASVGYLLTAPRRKLEITMHSVANVEFDSKDPEERVRVGFDFAALMASIAVSPAPTVVATLSSGTADASPSAVLDGALVISGTRVLQWVHGGLDSANYRLRCKAYGPNGEMFVLAGILPVKTA